MNYIRNVLFLDIETVPIHYSFEGLDAMEQELWQDKMKWFLKDDEKNVQMLYDERAGIYAEFAKVVCISTGFFVLENKKREFRMKSFSGSDEKQILSDFNKLLTAYFNYPEANLCGHNIKEFDVPFLCRRMLIHDLKLPHILDVPGKKPWETQFIDTLQQWKFGDYKHFTSLQLLAHVLGLKTSKDDISGADVARVFYEENNMERIVNYCQKDVQTTANVFLKLHSLPLMQDDEVILSK